MSPLASGGVVSELFLEIKTIPSCLRWNVLLAREQNKQPEKHFCSLLMECGRPPWKANITSAKSRTRPRYVLSFSEIYRFLLRLRLLLGSLRGPDFTLARFPSIPPVSFAKCDGRHIELPEKQWEPVLKSTLPRHLSSLQTPQCPDLLFSGWSAGPLSGQTAKTSWSLTDVTFFCKFSVWIRCFSYFWDISSGSDIVQN